ncbi:MAG: orotate phosphoribosyltransferase [Opitutaceae bacterium]|nr:orotate phosphoribosyltransferase [Opitutaceae bacterium]MBP9912869.1 orotate phosphoribosyltransferase [Opitutaceae bacterium]
MNAHAQLAKKVYDVAHLRGTFLLRSGTTSSEYFDKYRFEADPVILREVAEQLAQRLPVNFEVLAGLEMGGIPIATMLAQVTGKPALFVRKKAKDYGTCKFAEGGEVRGRRLLVIEDVVTSGGQILESVAALRGEGAIIDDVACVIDRCAGGRENLQQAGLRLISLFTSDELKQA